MSKKLKKLPRVFIACPYDQKLFKFSHYKSELNRLPWTCVYANTELHTKHLLDIIRKHLQKADMALFDLSMWNPNVALELGIAEGIERTYYILVNEKLDRDVPSDIKGLQRIQYTLNSDTDANLIQQISHYLFKTKFQVTRKIWKRMSNRDNSEYRYLVTLLILGYLRDHGSMKVDMMKKVGRGYRLRDVDYQEILKVLRSIRVIKHSRKKDMYKLVQKIFKK